MTPIDTLSLAQQPTVFQKLLEPVEPFVREQNQRLPKHPNQKYEYYDFFRLLIYYFVGGTKSLKLLINTRLNRGLLPAELGLRPVPYSTCQDAFERFRPQLFQAVFHHLLSTRYFKAVPELASLGTLYCIDGSLFPVISSMLWAEYTSNHQALKLHLCFELNRMIPVDFWVGSGNSSERQALRQWLAEGVTYIADRGYMSFKLCYEITQAHAHFILRTKANLLCTEVQRLSVSLPPHVQGAFENVSDQLIRYDNDPHGMLYRLVRFDIGQEAYCLLTNRQDLTTFQIIMLYAYRWQIELLFRFLKQTLNGLHLIRHDQDGVTIQFYALMITTLLELYLKQHILDTGHRGKSADQEHGASEPTQSNQHSRSRISGAEFVALLGNKVKNYWKIGLHWLTALRDLLASPFDQRVREILNEL